MSLSAPQKFLRSFAIIFRHSTTPTLSHFLTAPPALTGQTFNFQSVKTLADLKRHCTPGTVIEAERLKFKPATYFAVVAEHNSRHLGLVTTDRGDVGCVEWGAVRTWAFTTDTVTKMSRDDEPVALIRFRFLSEDELAALPEDVKALSQRYQPEAAAENVTTGVY